MRQLLLAFSFLSYAAHADEWKPIDYHLLGSATALLVIDWGQTRNLTRKLPQQNYRETNPILGDHPSIGRVDKYFTAVILGTVVVSYALPATYRRYFLGGVIVLETVCVLRNHSIGLRVEF